MRGGGPVAGIKGYGGPQASVTVVPNPIGDAKSAGEGLIQVGQALARVASGMEDAQDRRVAREAADQGLVAGAEAGKAVADGQPAGIAWGDADTIRGRAFNDMATDSYTKGLELAARGKIAELGRQFAADPTGLTTALGDWKAGIEKSIDQPTIRAGFGLAFDAHAGHAVDQARRGAEAALIDRHRANTEGVLAQRLGSFTQLARKAGAGDAGAESLADGERLAIVGELVKNGPTVPFAIGDTEYPAGTGAYSAEHIAQRFAALDAEGAEQRALGRWDGARKSQGWIDTFMQETTPGLTQDRKDRVHAVMRADLARLDAEAGAARAELRDRARDVVTWYRKGEEVAGAADVLAAARRLDPELNAELEREKRAFDSLRVFSTMTPAEQGRELVAMAEKAGKTAEDLSLLERARAGHAETLKALLPEVKAWAAVAETGRGGPELEALKRRAAGTPLEAALRQAESDGAARRRLAELPAAALDRFIADSEAGREMTPADLHRLDMAREIHGQTIQGLKTDAIGLATRRGVIPAVELDFTNPATMQARAAAGTVVRERYGLTDTPLLRPEETHRLKAAIDAGTGRENAGLMASLAKGFGPRHLPAVLAAVGAEAPEFAHAGTIFLEGDRGTAELLLDGAAVVRHEKAKFLPKKDEQWRADMAKALPPAALALFDPSYRAGLEAAVSAAYAGLSARANDANQATTDRARLKDAVAKVTGGLMTWKNGNSWLRAQHLVAPVRGMTDDGFADLMATLADDEIGQAYTSRGRVTAADIRDHGVLENAFRHGRLGYTVRIGDETILAPDGNPYQLDLGRIARRRGTGARPPLPPESG